MIDSSSTKGLVSSFIFFFFQPGYVCENGSCVEECLNECCADEDCPVDISISILCGNFKVFCV